MNLRTSLRSLPDRLTHALKRIVRVRSWLVPGALALLLAPIVADERSSRSGGGAVELDDFPEFKLEPLLPGGDSSGTALPPVPNDRAPLPDDRSIPLRDRFPSAQPRGTTDNLTDPVLHSEGATLADGFDWSIQPVCGLLLVEFSQESSISSEFDR